MFGLGIDKYMTKQQNKLRDEIMDSIRESIEFVIQDNFNINWCEYPFTILSSDGNGIYFSLTENDEEAKIIPWDQIINDSLQCDLESNEIKSHLKHVKKLADALEDRLKTLQ